MKTPPDETQRLCVPGSRWENLSGREGVSLCPHFESIGSQLEKIAADRSWQEYQSTAQAPMGCSEHPESPFKVITGIDS
jgi:hypothetical protein